MRLRIRSMVGLIPLFAVETLEPETLEKLPGFKKRLERFLNHRPDLANLVSHWQSPGRGQRRLLSVLRGHRMKQLLRRMLDESEFLSDYGVRAVLRHQPALQTDPNYRDCIPFYEYFHGDTGRGVGASHQSGWTSLIAKLIMPRA